jgi:glycerate-2-kinase
VLAAGKAAVPMFAAAAEGMTARAGVISTSLYGALDVPAVAAVFEAGHPAPNEASMAAGTRALALARESSSRGGLLVLLSGGASAMLALPAAGVTLEEKLDTARQLMAAGAAIDELNCVRKHLSLIKGGRLAAAAGRTVTFALSDVHGPVPDDPSVIGSGPTVPDPTTFSDALAVIRAYDVRVCPAVRTHLERGQRGEVEETIKPGDSRIRESVYTIVGNRLTAMDGASRAAASLGYRVVAMPAATGGEARRAGLDFAHAAWRMHERGGEPVCVIASGETTVTVRGGGLGGRNQEFVLGAAAALAAPGPSAVVGSAGTDGIDGPTSAAGAIVDSATLDRASHLGLSADAALADNDAYRFFAPLEDLIIWGPTGTNVGDVHVMLIA